MKCKECNELRRKKVNESKKKSIVKDYVRDWRKILLLMVLSVSIFSILVFVATTQIIFLPTYFRFSLLIIILLTWLFMFLTWAKIKSGLLSFAGLMFVVAPILEFKEPVTSVIFFCLFTSLVFLLIDIGIGVTFKIKFTPVERSWFIDQSGVRKIKIKRNGGNKKC